MFFTTLGLLVGRLDGQPVKVAEVVSAGCVQLVLEFINESSRAHAHATPHRHIAQLDSLFLYIASGGGCCNKSVRVA